MSGVMDVLVEARRRLAEPGVWARGISESRGPTYPCLCLLTAISTTADAMRWESASESFECTEEATMMVRLAVADIAGYEPTPGIVAKYNDAEGRTVADIIAVMNRAIVIAREQVAS